MASNLSPKQIKVLMERLVGNSPLIHEFPSITVDTKGVVCRPRPNYHSHSMDPIDADAVARLEGQDHETYFLWKRTRGAQKTWDVSASNAHNRLPRVWMSMNFLMFHGKDTHKYPNMVKLGTMFNTKPRVKSGGLWTDMNMGLPKLAQYFAPGTVVTLANHPGRTVHELLLLTTHNPDGKNWDCIPVQVESQCPKTTKFLGYNEPVCEVTYGENHHRPYVHYTLDVETTPFTSEEIANIAQTMWAHSHRLYLAQFLE